MLLLSLRLLITVVAVVLVLTRRIYYDLGFYVEAHFLCSTGRLQLAGVCFSEETLRL